MTAILDRRALLTGLAATVMTAAANQPAEAARRPFFARTGKRLGFQLYSLGDEAGKDLAATFAQVAAIGYRDIELPNLYGKTPAEVRGLADRAGLSLTSLHLAPMALGGPAGMLSLLSETQRIVDDLGVLGITGAVAPIAPFPPGFRPMPGAAIGEAIAQAFREAGADGWKRTAAMLNEKAAALKPHGITVGYHNHNFEFAPLGGTTGWQILVKETDPALVKFEIDAGWVAAAGLDPATFLNRHRGRVRWLHVKDLKASTKTNFALAMDPTEAGSGKQNWARILPAALRAGVEHFYVEQEPPFAIPRIEAARRSWEYLSKLRA